MGTLPCVEKLERRELLIVTPTSLKISGTGVYTVYDSQAFPDGSYVVSGDWSGSIDFGSGKEATANEIDGFIACYSKDDKLIWFNKIYGNGDQSVDAVGIDHSNNDVVYAADFDATTAAPFGTGTKKFARHGMQDMLVGRLNVHGTGLRVTPFNGIDPVHSILFPTSIDVNNNGESVLSGVFKGPIDFDPGTAQYPIIGRNDAFSAFVLGLTPKNRFKFASGLLSDGHDASYEVAKWGPDNVHFFAGGSGRGNLILDTFGVNNSIAIGSRQAGILTEFDGAGHKVFNDLLVGHSGAAIVDLMPYLEKLFVSGSYNENIDLNSGTGKFLLQQPFAGATMSGFLGEYDLSGRFITGAPLGATGSLLPRFLVPLPNNQVGVAGRFTGDGDLNPDPAHKFAIHSTVHPGTGKPTSDVFYGVYDANLHCRGGGAYGTEADEVVRSAFYDPVNNRFYLAAFPNGLSTTKPSDADALLEFVVKVP
jgi:hypothetical protein